MKKFENYKWVVSFVGILAGYIVGAMLMGIVFRFPDNMFGGVLAFAFMICLVAFGGDKETVDIIKEFVTMKKSPSDVGASNEDKG